MKTFAEFEIIGHIGQIRKVGTALKITIAADYGKRDDRGEYQSNPFWNTVTIFNENRMKWAEGHLAAGDLVRASGTLRDTSYEKDGETIYSTTIAADDLQLLCPKALRDFWNQHHQE